MSPTPASPTPAPSPTAPPGPTLSLPPAFILTRYRFTLTATDPLHLPALMGSTLRGGFGHAFKAMVCARPDTCGTTCTAPATCPYGYVFETAPPVDAEVLRNLSDIPRPFVIEPPEGRRTDFQPGDSFAFHVLLVGRARELLPYFILAFDDLGRRGLGRDHGRFRLTRVEAVDPLGDRPPELAYDEADPQHIHAPTLHTSGADILAYAARRSAHFLAPGRSTDPLTPGPSTAPQAQPLALTLHTPTRLKEAGRWVQAGPPFAVLIRAALQRVSALSYFHCGERWDTDFAGWIARARQVTIAASDTRWMDWWRFSGRQEREVNIGGLVGRVVYAAPKVDRDSGAESGGEPNGDLSAFIPLLVAGQLIHVGKATVFGNGRITVE
jgi:hypothetical protein